jgi:cation:H+ antiporter
VSLGVVLGSNVFNLAAMIGLSAVLAGAVHLTRRSLLAEGIVALLALGIASTLILDLISAGVAVAVFLAVAVPYVALLSRGQLHGAMPIPHAPGETAQQAAWKLTALIVGSVAMIILGAEGMVHTALSLAADWHIPHVLVGILILAVLTSLPNSFTAIRLGTSDRGTALVSENLNSNTINLAGGVIVPALIVGLGGATGLVKFDLAWLTLMTLFALLVLARPRGARRADGIALIVLYLGFVAVQLVKA